MFEHYQVTNSVLCVIVYGGYTVDLFEVDPELTVHSYNRMDLVIDDGRSLTYNTEGVTTFVSAIVAWVKASMN